MYRKETIIFPALIVFIFLATRFFFWNAVGVHFDASPIRWFWQFLDIQVLQNDLFEGLFYLHGQPPFYNLYLGVVLKFFYQYYWQVFYGVNLLCGLTLYFLIYRILLEMKVRPWLSFMLATLFILSPEAILHENWLFYTYPLSTMILVAAYLVLKYEQTEKALYAGLFVFAICLLCFTRSAFHLVFLVACCLLLLVVHPPKIRFVTVFSSIAIMFVVMLYFKNFVLFGFFGSSSWMGMNVWKIAPHVQVDKLIDEGKIPEVVKIKHFSPVSDYPQSVVKVPEKYLNVKMLSDVYKSTGDRNLHHYGTIRLSELYRQGAFYLIRNNFKEYLRNVGKAWLIFIKPSWDSYFLKENKQKLEGYIKLFTFVDLRKNIERKLNGEKELSEHLYSSYFVIPLGLLLVLIGVFIKLYRIVNEEKGENSPHFYYLFMSITIIYVSLIGNCLDIGENNRFRVMIDPILYLSAIISINEILSLFKFITVKKQV